MKYCFHAHTNPSGNFVLLYEVDEKGQDMPEEHIGKELFIFSPVVASIDERGHKVLETSAALKKDENGNLILAEDEPEKTEKSKKKDEEETE
jgi:hypothetical protein